MPCSSASEPPRDRFWVYRSSGRGRNTPFSPHFHGEYLVCAQLSGTEVCRVGRTRLVFEPSDVVLINPHQVHTGSAEGSVDLCYLGLLIDPSLVREVAAELGGRATTPEFATIRVPAAAESTRDLLRLEALLTRTETSPEPPATRTLELESRVLALVGQLLVDHSNLRTPRPSTSRVPLRRIARVVEYIHALPDDMPSDTSLDLAHLAALAGLSKFHFLRQFTKTVGMTPAAYVRAERLCRAAASLRTTRDPIHTIGTRVGFAEHPSFSRAFTRYHGLSPRAYQNAFVNRPSSAPSRRSES